MPEEIGNQISSETSTGRKSHKWIYIIITLVVIIIVGIVATLLKGKNAENNDIVTETISVTNEKSTTSDESVYDQKQYSWSTMSEGPYNDKISYATSTDLLNWKNSGQILAEHASVPDIVQKDGTLYTYFVDVSKDGYPEKVGLIQSTDNGKTWSSRQYVSIKGIGQKAPADPSPVLLSNGKMRLFYFDIGEARRPESKGKPIKNKIYSAISDDGINFVEETGVRFEYEGIFDPCVIKISDTSWRMYVGNQDGQKVFSATSSDGLSFAYEGIAFTGGAIPKVIYENDTYYLFTGGIEISSSKDGKFFTKLPNQFVVDGKITADPGVIKLGENSYLMVYKTKEMRPKN